MKWYIILLMFLLAISGVYGFGEWWHSTAKTTGLGIFKGAFIAGGLFSSSSDGIPLRDIHVIVWRNTSYVQNIAVIAEGNTDRTGIFTFLEHEGYIDYASYSYNGIHYIDKLIVGTILRDNLP